MRLRRFQTEILALAVLALGAGCGGSDAPKRGSKDTGVEAWSGENPDGELSALDTELAAPDGPSANPDVLAEADALAPDAMASAPDAELADAESPDAELADAGGEESGLDPNGPRGPYPGETKATVVLLPDTQYYSAYYPDIFSDQTRWIVEQGRVRRLAAVLHVGDLVDVYNDPNQWQVASLAMHALDGKVPYVLTTGNHDTDENRVCPISDYFVPTSMPWIAGTMEPGKIENNYALVDIGPTRWLVLALEWGPRDVVMTWANSVLRAYPERPAIIVTHAYLYSDGHRYDVAVSGLDNSKPNFQWFIPQGYGYTGDQGINDGEAIWQKVVVPNPNVRLVFSGHANGATRLTSSRPDGSLVHQVLADYQGLYSGTADDLGGSGYLRIMEFDLHRKTIAVQTYSPFLDSYLTDDANQFTLSLEM